MGSMKGRVGLMPVLFGSMVLVTIGGRTALADCNDITASDYVALPQYCLARCRHGTPEFEQWRQRFGPEWIHMHHYCTALAADNRSMAARTRKERESYARRAENQYNYVEKALKPDSPLLRELRARKVALFARMGWPGGASAVSK